MNYLFSASCVIHDGENVLLVEGDRRLMEGYILPTVNVEDGESFVETLKDTVRHKAHLDVEALHLRVVKHSKILESMQVYLIFATTDFKGKLSENAKWVSIDKLNDESENVKPDIVEEVMSAINGYPSEIRYYLNG